VSVPTVGNGLYCCNRRQAYTECRLNEQTHTQKPTVFIILLHGINFYGKEPQKLEVPGSIPSKISRICWIIASLNRDGQSMEQGLKLWRHCFLQHSANFHIYLMLQTYKSLKLKKHLRLLTVCVPFPFNLRWTQSYRRNNRRRLEPDCDTVYRTRLT
jgi:hypothetical protein